jgi:[ribosomal protein S5]-alanine N-acetyltransferase
MTVPILETENLILRPLRPTDLDDLYEYAIDPAVYDLGMWRPYTSRDACAEHLAELLEEQENGQLWWWALEAKSDNKMIGRCEISRVVLHVGRADIGYALHQGYWGKGYATQALRRVLSYAFEELQLNRVAAEVLAANAASIHLLEKMGMQREGILRQDTKIRGYLEDIHLYAILKSEWDMR